jgi:SAM-dependent methyltransferase
MAEADRERWDRIWRDGAHAQAGPPAWLAELDAELPRSGRALDVASGAGRVALYWAARGLESLAVDVSEEGLRRAREAAARAGLALETRVQDLECEPIEEGEGAFAAISCFHYLQRDLFPVLAARLAPGGVLACEIATVRNLERNAKPSRRFLLEPNELLRLCAPLEVVFYREGWQADRCEARILARRTSTA